MIQVDVMANNGRVPTERSRRILGELAETLGCPVAAFFDATQPEDLAMTEELLNLWFSIEDARVRHRILDCARTVKSEAARERA